MFGFDNMTPMQMAGLSILTSKDPNAVLQNLPQMMWQMKQAKFEQEMKLKEMEIAEKQSNIAQAAAKRDAAAHQQAMDFGKFIADRYSLAPNTNTPDTPPAPIMANIGRHYDPSLPEDQQWDASKMVTRQWKGDAAVPTGEEGNQASLAIMDIPLSIRQGWQKSPLAAYDAFQSAGKTAVGNAVSPAAADVPKSDILQLMMQGGVIKGYSYSDPASRFEYLTDLNAGGLPYESSKKEDREPKIINFMKSGAAAPVPVDVSTPEGYAQYQQLTKDGWYRLPDIQEFTTPSDRSSIELDKAADAEFVEFRKSVSSQEAKNEQLAALASVYSAGDVYQGTGATIVNSTLMAARDILGLPVDADLDLANAGEEFRRTVIAYIRSSVKDTNVSNFEQKGIEQEILSLDDTPESIAKAVAIRHIATQYAKDKMEWIEDKIAGGMSTRQALKAWDAYSKDKNLLKTAYLTKENIAKISSEFLGDKHRQSAIDYLSRLGVPGAESVKESVTGGGTSTAPETHLDVPMTPDGKPDADKMSIGKTYNTPNGPVIYRGKDANGRAVVEVP